MYNALIMAGGTGTRLWPLSRSRRPKQALALVDEQTLFQHAVDRIADLFPPERVSVVTRREHVEILAGQVPALPAANFIVEPEGRGTAPAIGLGAIHLRRQDPDAVMAVLTADHYIVHHEKFCKALSTARQMAEKDHLVTIGIHPTSPATGFGYIEQGEPLDVAGDLQVYRAERFTEKPDLETATRMLDSGRYSWNSGMFVWRVDRILAEFERQMPDLYAQLTELEAVIGTPDYKTAIDRIWPDIAKETIDYGIMEGADDIAVIPADIGWTDVGSWNSLRGLLELDEQGNAVVGEHVGVDTRDSLIFGGKRLIATIGVEDLVIVDTEDALLICPRDREQEVRALVDRLAEQKRDRYL